MKPLPKSRRHAMTQADENLVHSSIAGLVTRTRSNKSPFPNVSREARSIDRVRRRAFERIHLARGRVLRSDDAKSGTVGPIKPPIPDRTLEDLPVRTRIRLRLVGFLGILLGLCSSPTLG